MAGYSRMVIMSMSEEEIKRVLTEERETLSDHTAVLMVEELKRRAELGEEQTELTEEELKELEQEASDEDEELFEDAEDYELVEDIEELEELGQTIQTGSLCALGQTAANPVLSTIAHFKHCVHVREQQRSHGVPQLVTLFGLPERCE